MTVVLTFAGLGVALALIGWAGRRNSVRLGAVPGMPAAHETHRIRVIHRGATACLVIGCAFGALAAFAPLL